MKPGDDLDEIISRAAQREISPLEDKDIAIVTMKIVSKAGNRLVRLDKVAPSGRAKGIAEKTGNPARLVQAILDNSEKIIGIIPFYTLIREGVVDLHGFSRGPESPEKVIRVAQRM